MPNYYQNPASLSPYGETQVSPIMQGAMFPDRVRDYRTMFNQGAQAGDIENRQKEANYQDFLAQGPLRSVQRQRDIGAAQNEIDLQPGALKLGKINQKTDIDVAEGSQKAKVFEALQQLPRAQQQEHLRTMMMAAQALQMLGYEDKPADIMSQELKARWGIDVPAQYIQSVGSQDVNQIKRWLDESKINLEYNRKEGLQRVENEGAVQAVQVKPSSGADEYNRYKIKLMQDAQAAQEKVESGQPLSPKESAALKTFQQVFKEITYGETSKYNAELGAMGDLIKSMKPGATVTPKSTIPPAAGTGVGRSDKKPIENPTQEQHNQLKDGDPFIYNGKLYYKGKK